MDAIKQGQVQLSAAAIAPRVVQVSVRIGEMQLAVGGEVGVVDQYVAQFYEFAAKQIADNHAAIALLRSGVPVAQPSATQAGN